MASAAAHFPIAERVELQVENAARSSRGGRLARPRAKGRGRARRGRTRAAARGGLRGGAAPAARARGRRGGSRAGRTTNWTRASVARPAKATNATCERREGRARAETPAATAASARGIRERVRKHPPGVDHVRYGRRGPQSRARARPRAPAGARGGRREPPRATSTRAPSSWTKRKEVSTSPESQAGAVRSGCSTAGK